MWQTIFKVKQMSTLLNLLNMQVPHSASREKIFRPQLYAMRYETIASTVIFKFILQFRVRSALSTGTMICPYVLRCSSNSLELRWFNLIANCYCFTFYFIFDCLKLQKLVHNVINIKHSNKEKLKKKVRKHFRQEHRGL